jgi:C-terminal processing protease CtpA/Prc
MESRPLTGSSEWTQYSVKLPLPESAGKIYIGVIMTGKGQLWVDDLQVLIDGKDIKEAKFRPGVVYKAASDKEFDTGSRIDNLKLSNSGIKDLAVLGKVWGFLKYYHPAVANGDYNWDYELFRILPKVLESKNQTERNTILSTWVDSLGTFETASEEKSAIEKVKLTPDLSWIDNKTLGDKLANQLTRVRDAKRENKNYYIGLFPGIGNPQFKNEEAYKSMTYPDAGFRLLSLYRYWNIIQYYFPNKHLIEGNWNNILTEFIPKFANAGSELEYKKAVLTLIGRIHDTHANIWGKDETLEKFRGLNSPAIGITFVEDKAVVTKYWDQSLAEKSGLKIGDVIETINNRKVSDIVKERLDLTPASNYPTKLRDIAKYLLQTNESFLTIKYKRGNAAKEIQLETYPKDKFKINVNELFSKSIPPFKLIVPDIAYLYPGSLKRGEIAQLIPQIAKTKGLIIDLRSYPSDFIVFSLGEYLLPKPTSFVKFSMGNITTPGLFIYSDELKVGKDNNDYYKGKVVILINEITQSQAEYTTMAFRTAPRATVIGSTTAGADGNVSHFFLPGGIGTMISGIGVYYPDGKETQRIGIVPDIIIKPTIKGITQGRDELLERALEIINTK